MSENPYKKEDVHSFRIKVVSSVDGLTSIPTDERIVHMSFRPSMQNIFTVVTTCPDLEAIQLPKSYFRTIGKTIKLYMDEHNITLLEGDVWGHRGDLYPYYYVRQQVIEDIGKLKKHVGSNEELAVKIAQIHKITEGLAAFIIKDELSKSQVVEV